jgi:hypothetical protein
LTTADERRATLTTDPATTAPLRDSAMLAEYSTSNIITASITPSSLSALQHAVVVH